MSVKNIFIKRIQTIFISVVCIACLAGCGGVAGSVAEPYEAGQTAIEVDADVPDEAESDTENISIDADADEVVNDSTTDEELTDDNEEQENRIIVWIGDSLTQGSLGHENDNLANAPYVKLAELSGHEVEGFGFYGNNAHDILWRFRDETQENQSIDPDKVYVFWIGANDWVHDGVVSTDVTHVNEEVDTFISKGVEDYIVLGTIARKELREFIGDVPAFAIIDYQLMEHYGDRYMGVSEVITLDGYGPDDIHLTQDAYDRVAQAVYDKLMDMNYIQ